MLTDSGTMPEVTPAGMRSPIPARVERAYGIAPGPRVGSFNAAQGRTVRPFDALSYQRRLKRVPTRLGTIASQTSNA